MEHQPKVLLGVTGSIAAYKAAFLCRELQRKGFEVRVVMTDAATTFITPLTFSTLTSHKIYRQWEVDGQWTNHIKLGQWADLFLIAPATANTLADMANGSCNTLLEGCYLSARCPVWIAPAMDVDMWHHTATRRNVAQLENDGVRVLEVGTGLLASGLTGEGRMLEPEEIAAEVEVHFTHKGSLKGFKALVTAGPTHEPIDPVRYIGNHSTGTMGWQLAYTLQRFGAEVRLVLGPNNLGVSSGDRLVVNTVQTAEEMYREVEEYFEEADIAVFAAAVADFSPIQYSDQKVKKKSEDFTLELKRTADIAMEMGKRKKNGQICVGFALETDDGVKSAQRKLEKKNLDLIVLNTLNDKGAGFGSETNKVSLITPSGITTLPLNSKAKIATEIVDTIGKMIKDKR